MPLSGSVAPYGVRELKLVPTSGSAVTLPWAMMMKFKETTSTNELKGDDKVVASVTVLESVEWELEAGGISLEAYALMTGRTLTNAGTTPSQTQTMKGSAGDSFPYFKLYGKVIADTGDIHIKFYKLKVEEIEGEFKGEEFMVTKCSGKGIDAGGSTGIFEIVRNETATALPTT
jgi:hypothetical protein